MDERRDFTHGHRSEKQHGEICTCRACRQSWVKQWGMGDEAKPSGWREEINAESRKIDQLASDAGTRYRERRDDITAKQTNTEHDLLARNTYIGSQGGMHPAFRTSTQPLLTSGLHNAYTNLDGTPSLKKTASSEIAEWGPRFSEHTLRSSSELESGSKGSVLTQNSPTLHQGTSYVEALIDRAWRNAGVDSRQAREASPSRHTFAGAQKRQTLTWDLPSKSHLPEAETDWQTQATMAGGSTSIRRGLGTYDRLLEMEREVGRLRKVHVQEANEEVRRADQILERAKRSLRYVGADAQSRAKCLQQADAIEEILHRTNDLLSSMRVSTRKVVFETAVPLPISPRPPSPETSSIMRGLQGAGGQVGEPRYKIIAYFVKEGGETKSTPNSARTHHSTEASTNQGLSKQQFENVIFEAGSSSHRTHTPSKDRYQEFSPRTQRQRESPYKPDTGVLGEILRFKTTTSTPTRRKLDTCPESERLEQNVGSWREQGVSSARRSINGSLNSSRDGGDRWAGRKGDLSSTSLKTGLNSSLKELCASIDGSIAGLMAKIDAEKATLTKSPTIAASSSRE